MRISSWAVPGAIVGFRFLLFVLFGDQYHAHGDELYFLSCADHPAYGYVDHGPFAVWVAWIIKALALPGIHGLRFFSFLASCGALILVVRWAREAGASTFGQCVAGLVMLFAPVYLRASNLHHIPAFELLIWTATAYSVWKLIESERPEWWALIGVLLAMGVLTKVLILVWATGLGLGILLVKRGRLLWSPYAFSGAASFLLLLLPYVYWQAVNEWPLIQFSRAMRDGLSSVENLRILFLAGQVLYLHPVAVVIWGAGLYFSFQRRDLRPFGIAFVFFAGFLLVNYGKPYYLAAAFPPLIVAGVVFWSPIWEAHRRFAAGWLALQILTGAALLPMALPMLPLPTVAKLVGTILPFIDPRDLTSEFREQYGWREKAALAVKLRATRASQPVIFARHYMEAAAVDQYHHGTPVISTHMNWYLWGHGPAASEYLLIGYPEAFARKYFRRVEAAGKFEHPLAPTWVNGPMFYVRDPIRPISELWPEWKRYNHW